jgi:hypothetical protein
MAGQYQDRQDSKLYGSRLIIHRRVDLDNDNFYFRAKVDGHTATSEEAVKHQMLLEQ